MLVVATMDASTRIKRVYTEVQPQAALSGIHEHDDKSIRATAAAYAVPESALRKLIILPATFHVPVPTDIDKTSRASKRRLLWGGFRI
jgi:hypothetical protein